MPSKHQIVLARSPEHAILSFEPPLSPEALIAVDGAVEPDLHEFTPQTTNVGFELPLTDAELQVKAARAKKELIDLGSAAIIALGGYVYRIEDERACKSGDARFAIFAASEA